MFREDKTTQMAATFLKLAGSRMPYIKLIKLLYLADRKMLITRGVPITYDRWFSMDKGPVLSNTYNLILGKMPSKVWAEAITTQDIDVILCEDPGTEDLSRAEDKVIAEIFEEYGHLDRWDPIDLLHEFPEWQNPHGSSIPITYETVMLTAGFSEENIEATMDNIGAQDALERALALVIVAGFKAGDAFFIRDRVGTEKGHLHVALCNPYEDPSVIIVVRFNTVTPETDNTLILDVGDHPFINRPTAVSFNSLQTLEVSLLIQAEALRQVDLFERKAPASADLLARIRQGALTSDMSPKRMVTALKVQLGITEEKKSR